MRKILVFSFTLFLGMLSGFSQNNELKVVVFNPDVENISDSDALWLPGAIKDRIEYNNSYMNFVLVDNKNEKRIKELQKKSENSSFSSETAIELGKLTTAQYAIFSTIRKTGSTYSLSCNFTNLTSGEKKTCLVSNKKSVDELVNMSGCAADEIIIQLCEKIGINLSASQKYELRHGDEESTYKEDSVARARDDERRFKEQMDKFDDELKRLKFSTELESSTVAAKIAAEKAITEEKLKSAQLRAERLIEESQRKKEDAIADEKRTDEKKKRRTQLANAAAEKAENVRTSIMETSSIITKMNAIEMKKKALLDIRKNVEDNINEINLMLDEEMGEKIIAIRSKEYRAAEMADGVPINSVREKREKKVNALISDYSERKKKEEKSTRALAATHEKILLNEIDSDYKNLKKWTTISSLSNNVKTSIGSYNGKIQSWPVTLYLYSDNIEICRLTTNISYKDLTGKNIPSDDNEKEYEKYLDEVDIYSSCFIQEEPILTFEIEINAIPSMINPSAYWISTGKLYIRNTATNKILTVESSLNNQYEYKFPNSYDIRDKRHKETTDSANQKKKNIRDDKRTKTREDKKRGKKERNHISWTEKQGSGNGGMTGIRGGLGICKKEINGGDVQLNLALNSFMFMGVSGGMIKSPENLSWLFSEKYLYDGLINFGINFRYIYFMCGVGGLIAKTSENWIENGESKDYASYLLVRPSLGIDIPLTGVLGVYVQGNMDYISGNSSSYSIDIGLSLSAKNFTLSRLWSD